MNCICRASSTNQVEPPPDFPPDYRKQFSTATRVKGVAVFVFVAIVATAYVLLCSNQMTTLPQNFVNLLTHPDPTKLMLGVGVTAILVGGAAWIIYRARTNKDPYLECEIFRSRHFSEYIEEAVFVDTENPQFKSQAYIDKSTLDENGNGKAYLYVVKDRTNHYLVSTIVTLSAPLYAIGMVVYHTIRMCIVPFWVLAGYAIESCLSRPILGKQKRYKFADVIKEPGKSFLHIPESLVGGLAFGAVGIYSLVNPMGGRVLGSKIERDLNGGATRAEGMWLHKPQKLWNFGNLDLNIFLAGCWQPIGIVEYENDLIKEGSGKSITFMVEESREQARNQARNKGRQYDVFPRSQFEGDGI